MMIRKIGLLSVIFAVLASAAWAAIDPIPCAVGNKWEYDCLKTNRGTIKYNDRLLANMSDASSGSSVYEVSGVDNGIYDYKETTSLLSAVTGSRSDDKSEMKISNDPAGLKIHSLASESSLDDPKKESYDPALLYWIKDITVGKTWEVGTMRSGETTNAVSAKIVGRETVTVPAGTFKDCVKVSYIGDNVSGTFEMMGQTFTMTSGRNRGIYWIADGVGVVKELEISVSSAQAPGPAGGFVVMEGSTCTVSELRPGYIVK